MSDEEENSSAKSSKAAVPPRSWRLGGPFKPHERKEAMALFIEWLGVDPTVILACEYAGINSSTAYRWREKHKTFADEWENAVLRTKDVARSSIYRRGIIGVEETVVSMGQVVYIYEPVVDEEGNQRLDHRDKPLMKGGKPLKQRKYRDSLAALYARKNLSEYGDKPQLNIHAQLADLAEQRKQKVLAELEAAIKADEDKEPPDQEEDIQS